MVFGIFRKRPALDLSPGENVELETTQTTVQSEVVEISKKHLSLRPVQRVDVGSKDTVVVTFRKDQYTCSFEAAVVSVSDDVLPILDITYPHELYYDETTQQTDLVTLEKTLPVKAKVLGGKAHPCHTKEISGTGLTLDVEAFLKQGELLEMALELPEGPPLKLSGRVAKADRTGSRTTATVDYIGITEQARDRIVGFIFETQRDLRRRGII
ncbi:MAG: PilZ domain-containing protein [Armatimonadetes bacterium]|nr:PilZ domain-containing protein [Armatimonadota bacterium]